MTSSLILSILSELILWFKSNAISSLLLELLLLSYSGSVERLLFEDIDERKEESEEVGLGTVRVN